MTEPINPLAVLAAHQPYLPDDGRTCGGPCYLTAWPCEPYRLAEALAAALGRIELLTEPPEPLDPVEQDALDDHDWDYAMRMLSKARAANHGYYLINEDLRDRLLDAEDALAAEQAKSARVAEMAHRFELIPRARLLGALTAKAKP